MNLQIFRNYSQQGLYRSLDVFNYPNDFPLSTRILGYRFLLQHRKKEPRIIPPLLTLVESMKKIVIEFIHSKNEKNKPSIMDIVDILLEFSPNDGDELLKYLQKTKLTANNFGPTKEGVDRTIYSDSQNTHNKSLADSTKKIVKYICDKYLPKFNTPIEKNAYILDIESTLKKVVGNKNSQVVDQVLDKMLNDNAKFEGYNADDVLLSVFNWISLTSNQEIYKRLGEEILEMYNYCSSRIVAGLINSIQGFTNDVNLILKMSVKDQCQAVVYIFLTKIIKENKEHLDGLLDKNTGFLRYVENMINNKRLIWMKEYGQEFSSHINSTVNEYLDHSLFN